MSKDSSENKNKLASIDHICQFWFGTEKDDGIVAVEKSALWWSKDPSTDNEIRQKFGGQIKLAANGKLADLKTSPRGRLALILLTDQFPRNIFRATAQAFAYDHLALEWASGGVEQGFDLELRPIERVFFYLPFEHAESLDRQRQSVELFRKLAASVPIEWQNTFAIYLDFAERHCAVVERFGRFPHRNDILGRASTEAEIAFLAQPGSSF